MFERVKELYEKYKGDYPMPDSPEPGFKQRPKADFQYVVNQQQTGTDQLAEAMAEAAE